MSTEFWLLEAPDTNTRIVTENRHKRITCAAGHVCIRHVKIGELAVELPLRSLADFEWTIDSDVLISEHALQVLDRHSVTGFEVRPVAARYRIPTGEKPPPLFELIVTGWGGLAARASGVHITDSCRECRWRLYRVSDPIRLIDSSAWDGSDLFMIWPLPRFRFLSDRLAEIIRQERLSGIDLLPADRLDVVLKPGDGLCPGPLDTWMPEERAREIGKHFDVLEG